MDRCVLGAAEQAAAQLLRDAQIRVGIRERRDLRARSAPHGPGASPQARRQVLAVAAAPAAAPRDRGGAPCRDPWNARAASSHAPRKRLRRWRRYWRASSRIDAQGFGDVLERGKRRAGRLDQRRDRRSLRMAAADAAFVLLRHAQRNDASRPGTRVAAASTTAQPAGFCFCGIVDDPPAGLRRLGDFALHQQRDVGGDFAERCRRRRHRPPRAPRVDRGAHARARPARSTRAHVRAPSPPRCRDRRAPRACPMRRQTGAPRPRRMPAGPVPIRANTPHTSRPPSART